MSFILDALRKSEHERQRDDVLGISRLPTSAPGERLPAWALTVMATLALLALGLAYAWWSGLRPAPTVTRPATVAEPAPRPVATPAPRPREQLAGAPATPPAPAVPSSPATSANPTGTASAMPTQTGERGAAATETTAPADTVTAVPTLAELRGSGVLLPDLDLQLHVYSDTAAERFVFINGSRYGEGEVVTDDARIETITAEGVLMQGRDRQFLLPKN